MATRRKTRSTSKARGSNARETTNQSVKARRRSRGRTYNPQVSDGRHVTIRMYNVGFGDAFLVLVPDGNTQRRILFDCGSIEGAPGMTMKAIVERIVRDVTDADGVPRIDVVVATHRHKDHVSGFGRPAWTDVRVREVWMPWTEHPTDEDARRIRDIQSRFAMGLNASLTARAATLKGAESREMSRYQDIAANALMLSNDAAMKTLHSGFSGNPQRRFLPERSEADRTLETEALPGVKVHIMGPSRSPDVIRDMNPPKGESFLRLLGAVDAQSGRPPSPFPSEFRHETYTGAGTLQGDDLQEIERAGSLSDLAVAVALDRAINGTSLMLMLEISGSCLLFPGDAQYGTWLAAMEDLQWRELLTRVSFYKIGHHGSHNATPRVFVDDLIPDGICAMASTLTRRIWPDIPRGKLLSGLAARNAVVARSDQHDRLPKSFRLDEGVIEARIPV